MPQGVGLRPQEDPNMTAMRKVTSRTASTQWTMVKPLYRNRNSPLFSDSRCRSLAIPCLRRSIRSLSDCVLVTSRRVQLLDQIAA